MNNSKRIYRAAIYVRLSKEDGDLDDVRKAESNSISNQKSLILNYLKDKEDIEIVSIREDDGYSGATFDRPAFKLMMQDVKDGIIDCIVVKDLSRFAREYIDAGRYIERMFPAMGIRFIAINDAYDSADTQAQGNEIIIPFKNLINDAYCRDISIKIRSHLETKRQNGEFVGNYCVYGYKKSEIDHNVIVPDEYAGPVVQDIFHWIKNGMSLDAISDKLNALGILSPMAYKLSKGENYKTAFQKKDELLWTPVAVRRIATNIIYTGKDESNSITGQRKLLYAYIKKTEEFAGFEVLEYFDDGYSGTMFNNRAEFQRLIQDAELGRFECIIVKDFSRFGRDYLEVGNYLEFVFPAMGMRFISVNDNYDSDRNFGVTGGMDVAYKNLIYQLYSMDLSRKVKSARRTRNLSGEYTASFVCYGYKKDPDDKHKLIIDEEAAKVVVEIFSLIIAGYNASEVARMLNERKIPTRVQNQWKNGINYVPVHNKGDYMWDNSEVIAIVQNEQYKGIMIQNKCETVGFGDNKKVRKRNKEDWSVVEGAIPRIVSDEMFDEVNKMLRVEARGIEKSTKKRKKNLFICPYCGRKLMNSSAVCTPKLLCPKRRMVRTGECQQIFMLKSEAQDKVLEITKEICRTLIQEEELKKASKDKRKVTSDEYLISELKAEYDRISNSTVSCYQSYREGKYTKEEYVQLRKTNQELLADLENQISDLQEKVANQEPDAEEKIEQLTQYSMLEQYDGDVLSNIIDKVLIYNDKDIEVVFKGENFIRNAV